LPDEVRAIVSDPHAPARPIPANLLDQPLLMLGMDQFKDIGGFVRYAARVRGGIFAALAAWRGVGWNETCGAILGVKVGPRAIDPDLCDPELRQKHLRLLAPATARSNPAMKP
jgi:hypothetical protein